MTQKEKAKDNEKQIKAIAFGLKCFEEVILKVKLRFALKAGDKNSKDADKFLKEFIIGNIGLITEVLSTTCE